MGELTTIIDTTGEPNILGLSDSKLKEFRKAQKLTQTQFAEKIGITTRQRQTVMEWETGKVKIPKPYQILFKLLFIGKIDFTDFQ